MKLRKLKRRGKTHSLVIRLDQDLWAAIKEEKRCSGIPASEQVRRSLRRVLMGHPWGEIDQPTISFSFAEPRPDFFPQVIPTTDVPVGGK